MKNILAIAALLILATSCGTQPAVPEFRTVEAEGFVKHPKGTADDHGLRYRISFTWPAKYAGKAVLKTLQQRFAATLQSWYFQNPDDEPDDYSSLPPDKAVNAIIDAWKSGYSEETRADADNPAPEWATAWELRYSNAIPFVNETLLQLKTETYRHVGGAHGATRFRCHLFNLQTGEEYRRDDIFKPEAATRIHRLLVAALLDFWEVKSPREIGLMEEEVWTENTGFAVTSEGITFVYSDYELGSYALGCAEVTIPYAKIFPCLREGTPVWDVAGERIPGHSPEAVAEQKMDDDEFLRLLDEIYRKLPASVMPDHLKTVEQRREVNLEQGEDMMINVRSYTVFDGGGGHWKWEMAAYPAQDNRNVVLIVQYGGGLDGYTLQSDKTLIYNIATARFTEIERSMDALTVDEMIVEKHFETRELYEKAKACFAQNPPLYYREFDKEGFMVIFDFFEFWLDNEEFGYYSGNFMVAHYKWNGERFVKEKVTDN